MLARTGEVDKLLDTVVNNLEITNNLDIQPEVRCRVLLTSPIESFSVGHWRLFSRMNWHTSHSDIRQTRRSRIRIGRL
jgi:hypothetical protein